jgi:nucleotide-binding universal stress UspA family protein
MTFTAIMTHVQAEIDAAPRLACARSLAERFKARLIGVGAEMIPPLAFDSGYGFVDGEWAVAMGQSIDAELARARTAFEAATRDFAPGDAVWLSGLDSPTPVLAAASRAADIIVVGGAPRRTSSPYRDVAPAELALQAGRPVLIAPPAGPALRADRVLVAWRDTREARRALADATPFLEAAGAVLVLEISEPGAADDSRIRTEDVAGALRRRGVAAVTAKVAGADHGTLGARILDEARSFGADLIVLGCYGHSRLGEWVFGGVTRDLLAQDEAYLLLSH